MPRHSRDGTQLRRLIAVTLATAALGLPFATLAQTAKEQELEKRVAELEKLVQQLVAEKSAAAPAPAPAPAPAAATAAAAPAKPAPAPIQGLSITPNAAPNTTFVLTGYLKADANFTNTSDGELGDSASGRDYYVPGQTPVGGLDEGTDLNAHVKQSRINFGTDTILEGGDKLSTRFEIDFFGSALGSQNVSNTYAPVVRHAYVQWREWLIGQTWSNFMDPVTLPEVADFIGPTDGTTFVRQPQVRWTKGGLSLSAENRETSITPYTAGALPVPPASQPGRSFSSDDGWTPDLTARYAWKGKWGHVAVAGLVRELVHESTGAQFSLTGVNAAIDDSTWTGALSASGKFIIGKDDVRWMALYGNLGRYVALNFSNDAILNGDGELESIDGYAGFVAYRHVWGGTWRSTFAYAMQSYDNEVALSATTNAYSPNKSSWSVLGNLFYSPLPKLDVGAEFRYGERELENGTDGDFNRLQLTTKYSF
jgi:DcaP outer membrane protein